MGTIFNLVGLQIIIIITISYLLSVHQGSLTIHGGVWRIGAKFRACAPGLIGFRPMLRLSSCTSYVTARRTVLQSGCGAYYLFSHRSPRGLRWEILALRLCIFVLVVE